ncbi:MAG: NAD(P)-dependent oxidoreductase [Clostridium sp.]|jgi:nucleoside-diphosphate-sugar epimerase|nr:NAD(P)-dependent oxidoreductase [Clostridium sp.]
MDIFLIGGVSGFVNAIIDKLNKESHRVYVLTGSAYHVPGYHQTFEKYCFAYDSDSLAGVFDSVNPDVVLFMGAYDVNYGWRRPQREAVRFQSGLLNVLLTFSALRKGRLIYLSSQEVFQESRPYNIPEEEPAAVTDLRPITLRQGEELCLRYRELLGTDTMILRMDRVCDVPRTAGGAGNICSRMCLEALRTGRLTADDRQVFSLLFLPDAVEFLYRAMVGREPKSSLYHVSSSRPVSGLALARLIQENMKIPVEVREESLEYERRQVLSNMAFRREFRVRVFHSPEDIAKRTAEYMERHRSDFLEDGKEEKKFFGKLLPTLRGVSWAGASFLENIVCFSLLFFLHHVLAESGYLAQLDLYLPYVLLFAFLYGQRQALVSALLAVGGYCFGQTYGRSGLDVMLDYHTYVWLAQLFVLGLSVGYLKDQLKLVQNREEMEVEHLTNQLSDILDINSSNVRVKNMLEAQVVNQNDSLGKIYEITSALDQYEPEEVLFYAAEILAKLMGTQDAAIYTVANRSYARLFSSTSDKARQLGNSIQYTSLTDMYDMLKEKRVFVNKTMDARYPFMANGIYSEERMQLILMVWGIPWERMTLGQSNILAVIGYLIQNAVVRANRYIEALEQRRYVTGTNILEPKAFAALVRAYLGAQRKNLARYAVLAIDTQERQQEEAGAQLGKMLRQTDFLGKLDDGKLYALLSNTDRSSAEFVVRRLSDAGYTSSVQEEIHA